MGSVRLTIFRFAFLLSLMLGVAYLCEPSTAYGVTSLTLGDGTVYFDESNNYYTALVNAYSVASSRGYSIPDVSIEYLLQTYPFLEYIDADNPPILLDIYVDDYGNYALSISSRSATGRGYGYDNSSQIIRFGGCYTIGYIDGGQFYTNSLVSNVSTFRIYGGYPYDDIFQVGGFMYPTVYWGDLKSPFTRETVSNLPLDELMDMVESGDIWSAVLYYRNTDGKPYSIGNSCFSVPSNTTYPRWKPIILSTSVYVCDADVIYYNGNSTQAAVHLEGLYGGDSPLNIYNDVAWSVIGESITPDVIIPLVSPSPVPTQPYSQLTPTPMVVNSGVFGFGGNDVNVSSDYQNALAAWINGLDRIDNILFLRVMADTVLSSNLFSWLLIPISFMLISWVWGLKPIDTKGGDKDD